MANPEKNMNVFSIFFAEPLILLLNANPKLYTQTIPRVIHNKYENPNHNAIKMKTKLSPRLKPLGKKLILNAQ